MTDPTKLIAVFQALLVQLEQTISQMPKMMAEDGRAENLGNQIQRIKNVLRKHQDHEKREKELEKQNLKNDPRH